jgi:hypothetical protein
MSPRTIGILAASGGTLFALAALAHGGFVVLLLLGGAAVATGVVAYYSVPTPAVPSFR